MTTPLRNSQDESLVKQTFLTAGLQEPPGTTRADFISHPMESAMTALLWHIRLAQQVGYHLEVGAALTYPEAYVPAESMLDPVAPHVPMTTRRDGTGIDLSTGDAKTIIDACGQKVHICDVAFFDNPLHHDDVIRNQVHEHMLRCARAAVMLRPVGCTGVAGFVGRNYFLTPQQNLAWFEKHFIPILQKFKKMGVVFYGENCPMPGLTTGEMFIHNMCHSAYMFLRLYWLCKKHGVEDVFRITYDVSHDILQGTSHYATFAVMKAAGLGHVLARFHGKNQYRDPVETALHGVRGPIIDLGCEIDGQPHPDPRERLGAWQKMGGCRHGMKGIGHYNPVAMNDNMEDDWFDQHHAMRSVLGLDPLTVYDIAEHEFNAARTQDAKMIERMLRISMAYSRHIDAAADAQYRSTLWSKEDGIELLGTPNPKYTLPGLQERVDALKRKYAA